MRVFRRVFSVLARAILDTGIAVSKKNVRETGFEFVHCQVLEKMGKYIFSKKTSTTQGHNGQIYTSNVSEGSLVVN